MPLVLNSFKLHTRAPEGIFLEKKDDQVIRKGGRNFGGSIFNCWTFPKLPRECLWGPLQAGGRSSCLHSKLDGEVPALRWKVAWICTMAMAVSLYLEPSVFFFLWCKYKNINSEAIKSVILFFTETDIRVLFLDWEEFWNLGKKKKGIFFQCSKNLTSCFPRKWPY